MHGEKRETHVKERKIITLPPCYGNSPRLSDVLALA